MRKLATIREIKQLDPIPGADFIERATVDGWELVVKKGEFKVGDLGVYFEIDSMLPNQEIFAFLGKTTLTNKGIGYRLRTIKLRKQVSQGLMLPLTAFPDLKPTATDVTEDLGVWLYEPLYKTGSGMGPRESIGVFPYFLRKTDQERIQNKVHYFETYADEEFEATKKLDGSSLTVWNYDKVINPPVRGFWNKIKAIFKPIKAETFGVCSRNINLREVEGNAFWDIANELKLREMLKGHNVALQGELISPTIQNNHEKVDKPYFYLFDIFDIDKQQYMLPSERMQWLAENNNGLVMHVPFVNDYKIFNKCKTLPELLRFVEGPSMNKGTISEGMVFKSTTNRNLSFKCVSNKYLLKCEV